MGRPTAEWLRAKLWKYHNQRMHFVLKKSSVFFESAIKHAGFDPNRPIILNGIYTTLWKRRTDGSAFDGGPTEITFELRNIVLAQGDKKARVFGNGSHSFARRASWYICADDIAGVLLESGGFLGGVLPQLKRLLPPPAVPLLEVCKKGAYFPLFTPENKERDSGSDDHCGAGVQEGDGARNRD